MKNIYKNLFIIFEVATFLSNNLYQLQINDSNILYNNISYINDNKVGEITLNNKYISKLQEIESNEICSNNSFYKTSNYFEIKDFYDNEYILTSFEPMGYSVISKINLETVEFVFDSTFDFNILLNQNEIRYIPTVGFFIKEDDLYKNIFDNQKYDFKVSSNSEIKNNLESTYTLEINKKKTLINSYIKGKKIRKSSSNSSDWIININEKVINADYEVPYSWFFKYFKNNFGYTSTTKDGKSKGLCEYIALVLLLSYYDFFYHAGYFSNTEFSKYIDTSKIGTEKKDSFPKISALLVKDLYNKYQYVDLNISDLNNVANGFLKNKNINYSLESAYWYFGNPEDVIRNKNRPDMLSGSFPTGSSNEYANHNIIAYGYFSKGVNSGKFLTHYGWNNYTQCLVSRNVFRSWYDWSIVNKETTHTHRYCFNINGNLKCGCKL